MANFKKGDVVICTRFKVSERLVVDKDGIRMEKYVDDHYFNREAIVTCAFKDYHFEHGTVAQNDKDEYEIEFTDNHTRLAWVSGKDLVKKQAGIRITREDGLEISVSNLIK